MSLCLCNDCIDEDELDIHWHSIEKCAEQCDCDDCPCPYDKWEDIPPEIDLVDSGQLSPEEL